MSLEIVITETGRAALVNAANTGTSPVVIASAGLSSTAHVADVADTVLPGEFARVTTIGGTTVADDVIHVSIRDTGTGAYTLRSFALYLDDGTLFATYGQASAILAKTESSSALIAVDVVFADVSASAISFGATNFTDPDATTSKRGLIELATTAEAQAGNDALRALTPATAKAAVLGWLLGLDGAGSGFDADLLDGQHGAYYADIAARLGFTPLNAAAYTAASVLAKLVTVDGAGSGVDADLLDGQHGAYYTNIAARLGFTPLDTAAFTAASVLAKLITVDGAGSGVDADLLDGQQGSWYSDIAARLGFAPVNRAGDTMTGQLVLVGDPTATGHAARKSYVDAQSTAAALLTKLFTVDGSGCGLDADLLDGKHATDFALANTFSTGSNANGRWWKRPDGDGGTVIVQQGAKGGMTGQGAVNITFPTPMTSTDYDLQLNVIIPAAGDYDNYVQEVNGSRTLTGVQVYAQDPSSGASNVISGFRWRIEGY